MRPRNAAIGAATIRCVDKAEANTPREPGPRIEEEMEESRLLMTAAGQGDERRGAGGSVQTPVARGRLDPHVGQARSVIEPVVDLRGLLRGLHEHGVTYVLFGALGMVFYGFARNTHDLDIVVAPLRRISIAWRNGSSQPTRS